jgi:hypothetical protein
MDAFLGILVIIGLIICWVIGRAAMGAMGIIMFDTPVGLVMKPMIFGLFIVFIGFGIIGLIFKGIFWILGALFSLIVALFPIAVIIGLIVAIFKIVKNK